MTIEVQNSQLDLSYHWYLAFTPDLNALHSSHPGCEAWADEDDGADRFLFVSLLLSLQAADHGIVQAADQRPERSTDSWTLRQRGSGLVHAVGGRAWASCLHRGDATRQSSGPSFVCEP